MTNRWVARLVSTTRRQVSKTLQGRGSLPFDFDRQMKVLEGVTGDEEERLIAEFNQGQKDEFTRQSAEQE